MLATPRRVATSISSWFPRLLQPLQLGSRGRDRHLLDALRQLAPFEDLPESALFTLARCLGERRILRLAQLLDAAAASESPSNGVTGLRFGAFRIEERLRAGGMATVYSAVHVHTETAAALKVLPATWASEELRERLAFEASALQRVHHHNVIRVFEVGEVPESMGGGCYMAMEWLPNAVDRALAAQAPEPLDPDTALRIALGVANGLAAVHAADLVHRDVKPSNILLRADGTPVLTDFGLAKALHEHHHRHQLTAPNLLVGTADYIAPEHAAGDPVDARADLYSLGIVLYELLSGAPPFAELSAIETLRAHVDTPPPPLPDKVPGMARMVVERALAKDPAQRFQSAEEMAIALQAAVAEARALSLANQRAHPRIACAEQEEAVGAAIAVDAAGEAAAVPAWPAPELRVDYWSEDEWVPLPCVLLDVSFGGAGVVSCAPPEIGSKIRLVLRDGHTSVVVTGSLVYESSVEVSEPTGARRFASRCGIAFDHLAPTISDAVARGSAGDVVAPAGAAGTKMARK